MRLRVAISPAMLPAEPSNHEQPERIRNMKSARTLALASLIGLAACAKPVTAAHELFHLQEDYDDAEAAGKVYSALPQCQPDAADACSEQETRARLHKADGEADAAIAAVKAALRTKGYSKAALDADLSKAHESVTAFADLIDGLPTRK